MKPMQPRITMKITPMERTISNIDIVDESEGPEEVEEEEPVFELCSRVHGVVQRLDEAFTCSLTSHLFG